MTKPTFINTTDALLPALDAWRDRPWIAVDTEFVREETYRALLCLVQIGDGATSLCVDVTAIDPAPVFEFLARPSMTKVFHSAGQDLELFVQHTGDCPRPLFDTQIAAALLGHGEQLGYAALVERRLGEKVDKTLSRTDWTMRPLTAAAIAYAADDVRHLAVMYPGLRKELEQRGRLAWLEEECARWTDATRYLPKPELAWRSIKGLARLDGAAQQRAAKLAAWRELEAQKRNRPRRWILDDEALCRLAARAPTAPEQMKGLEGISDKLIARVGAELVTVLQEATASSEVLVRDERPDAELRRKVQGLRDTLTQIAEKEQIAATLIATRNDLETLAIDGASADIPLLRGWRREVAGNALLGT